MPDDFQVFISYARKDNVSHKDDPGLKGFVTFLHQQLIHELTDLGAENVKIWRDTHNISDVDQFGPILEKQIVASSVMLVVMSPNWLASANCRAEVERFAQRWIHEGEEAVKGRLNVIRKRPNDRELWPVWLQGQVGIPFYSEYQSDDAVLEDGYFWRGKVRDETYHTKVRELAGILSRKAMRARAPDPQLVARPVKLSAPKTSPSGRTIFVAKPATDMKAPYDRVVHELTGRGYAVVPEPDIPLDETAVAFIDGALAGADLSVHLLGVKPGYAPQDVAPIVKLQLERAAKRQEKAASLEPVSGEPAASDRRRRRRGFRRIVWAPRIVESDTASQPQVVDRDPLAALSVFAQRLPTDEIDGQGLSKFIDFLVQTVAADEAPIAPPPPPGTAPKVYLYHEREDADFARDVARALKAHDVEPLTTITVGSPQEVRAHHRRRLAECDAVALCWATTPEVKLSARTNEIKNWRQLRRAKPFAYRGLVVGPPPNQDKKNSEFHFSKDEIDLQLDLSEPNGELAKLVDGLVPRAAPVAP